MRVYLIKGEIEGKVKALGFVRSELQAKKAVPHIEEYTEDIESIHYEKENVPNHKKGLIDWLNSFCHGGEEVDELINEILEEY